MSFKAKTILLLIVLSLAPYVFTMTFLGNAYRNDVETRLVEDMDFQLGIMVERLDQNLQNLRNDMGFVASLDIMNDILTGDLDRRIVNLLLTRKNDLNLVGNFHVADGNGVLVATTDMGRIGQPQPANSFHRVPVLSSFDNLQIGELSADYEPENLLRLFPPQANYRYSLLVDGTALPELPLLAESLRVEAPLQQWPGITVRLEQDRNLAFALLDTFTRNYLIALLIGMAAIAVIALLTANYILHPILLLSGTARKVTQTQDYSQRVQVERSDEIGQLALAFNSMISGMQDMIVRLREESENRLNLAQEKNRAEMLQSLSNKLSKYLSPQIYESIFSGEKDVTLGSSRKKLTIFFSDIVNFTGTTDQMESEDLTQLLNQYLREMTDIALRYGATVDKYIGDAIMIFFGDPHSRGVAEDARQCVAMAIAMQKRVRELQEEWRHAGYAKPFFIRVGIHTGYCTVGNFGTESRMDYTIIGSSVNLASRIESNAEPGTIYISEDTCLLVQEHFDCVPVVTLTPKGMTVPLQLYRVKVDARDEHHLSLKQDGFSLQLDPDRLTPEGRRTLQSALETLRSSMEPPADKP